MQNKEVLKKKKVTYVWQTEGVSVADYLIFLWGMERAHVTEYLVGANGKVIDCFN